MGWMMGLEPTTTGITTQEKKQHNYQIYISILLINCLISKISYFNLALNSLKYNFFIRQNQNLKYDFYFSDGSINQPLSSASLDNLSLILRKWFSLVYSVVGSIWE